VEQEAVERLATVRLTVVDDVEGPVIDLLFASSGIEREVVAAAESLELLCNGLCSGPICAVARAGRGRIPGVMSTTGPSCGLSSRPQVVAVRSPSLPRCRAQTRPRLAPDPDPSPRTNRNATAHHGTVGLRRDLADLPRSAPVGRQCDCICALTETHLKQ
jgi:hypothetical protein